MGSVECGNAVGGLFVVTGTGSAGTVAAMADEGLGIVGGIGGAGHLGSIRTVTSWSTWAIQLGPGGITTRLRSLTTRRSS